VRAEAAARLGRVQRRKEKLQRLIAARNDPNKWLGENDSDWEMCVLSMTVLYLLYEDSLEDRHVVRCGCTGSTAVMLMYADFHRTFVHRLL